MKGLRGVGMTVREDKKRELVRPGQIGKANPPKACQIDTANDYRENEGNEKGLFRREIFEASKREFSNS